jgi:hypothetical protein
MSRPSALVLTPRLPWPLDDGGRIGLWQTVWSVSRSFDTTLISLVPPADAGGPVPPALAALGIEILRVPHRPPWTPVALVRGPTRSPGTGTVSSTASCAGGSPGGGRPSSSSTPCTLPLTSTRWPECRR